MDDNNSNGRQHKSSFPRNALQQATTVFQGWRELGESLQVPNLTLAEYEALYQRALALCERVDELHRERQEMVQQRNALLVELWDLTKRIRNAARAMYGDMSKEVEVVIGHPARRRGRKKTKNK